MMAPTAWRATNTSTPSPRFLAVELKRQLLPGSFEHALNHLIDHELDLSGLMPGSTTTQPALLAFGVSVLG
jgi:hypothetical protein